MVKGSILTIFDVESNKKYGNTITRAIHVALCEAMN